MDHTGTQWRFREGDRVISADEKTPGKVVAVAPDSAHPTHLVVRGGLPIESSKAPAKNWYRGTVYSFCSWECKRAFDAHPERYVPVAHVSTSPVNDQHVYPH